MQRLKALLHHFFYKDKATVYRSVPVENGYIDSVSEDFEVVYEDIPCHLAQYGKDLYAARDDRTQKITENLRLCYNPEYVILEDDVIEVQHQGQIFKLWAGTAFFIPATSN